MDTRTMICILAAIGVIAGGVFMATRASVERTQLTTQATVAKAQEHTKRAEGRHQLMDVLGLIRR